MRQHLTVVNILIAINVLLYFASQSANAEILESLTLYFPKNDHFASWQLFTHMFMHASFAHIFLNVFAIWMFGTPLERLWGSTRFLLYFFISGIGAALFYTAIYYYQFDSLYNELLNAGMSPDTLQSSLKEGVYYPSIENSKELGGIYLGQMLGASGAVYGILVAFGMLFPNTKLMLIFLPVPIAAKYFIPALISLDVFFGFTGYSLFGANIAHFAHVGGALVGLILMFSWRKQLMP
ncbi:MAG: rhomboid family intramembrane serine protease [Thiotrichaceae bacterium]